MLGVSELHDVGGSGHECLVGVCPMHHNGKDDRDEEYPNKLDPQAADPGIRIWYRLHPALA